MSTTKIFKLAVSVILFWKTFTFAQDLTISSTGQTGTSGTNWTTSGTNPITLTASGGTANVNTSVIIGYLNSGTSVIVHNNNLSGNVVLTSDLTKSAGGEATLTLRSDKQAPM